MARITRVAHAQQRFETVPVLDEYGNPKTVAVQRKDGTPKTTKIGRAITRVVTVADKTKPLPNHSCDKCGSEIRVGDPYKWIAPKSGPYGGTKRYRCDKCPNWHEWEYSSSTSARTAQIAFDAEEALAQLDTDASEEDFQTVLDDAAQAIRDLAEEKQESADNIESGFGHSTSQSEELAEVAEQLNGWADEVESTDIPPRPDADPPENEEAEELADAELGAWLEEAFTAVSDAVNDSPI